MGGAGQTGELPEAQQKAMAVGGTSAMTTPGWASGASTTAAEPSGGLLAPPPELRPYESVTRSAGDAPTTGILAPTPSVTAPVTHVAPTPMAPPPIANTSSTGTPPTMSAPAAEAPATSTGGGGFTSAGYVDTTPTTPPPAAAVAPPPAATPEPAKLTRPFTPTYASIPMRQAGQSTPEMNWQIVNNALASGQKASDVIPEEGLYMLGPYEKQVRDYIAWEKQEAGR
jgi:hypothetical protein